MPAVLDRHVEITPGVCGGKPRIAGHRITVQNVALLHEAEGRSVDEIATEYGLSLGDVYAALAYYHDHREAIDAQAADDEAFVAEQRVGAVSRVGAKLGAG